ncbi:MAG: extracellular solute-binding protein [Hyphomicrobiaceae bacterium]
MRRTIALLALAALHIAVFPNLLGHNASRAAEVHAIAMHGQPALPPDFEHFPYANPNAPKGGLLTLGLLGTFDNLNPFIVKGTAPGNVREYIFDSLMARSADEPFTLYALIAERIEVPDDRSSVTFHINPDARFSDDHPITADDVAFSHRLLRDLGRPFLRSHYAKVTRIEQPSSHTITFVFDGRGDREIPLILALMPILPRHAIRRETFAQTTLSPMIGSGPYTFGKIEPGRRASFMRNPRYWARDLPSRRGLFNFDEIRIEHFRNHAALFEAFKTGEVSFRLEENPARWIDSYDFPAVRTGIIKKYGFPVGVPAGMAGLVFNTRKKKFADPRVRRALLLAFDAHRINQQMFHGRYVRSTSYFARSTLASTGQPASQNEQALLAPFPGSVKENILTGKWTPPDAKNRQELRRNLRQALKLFDQAGYRLKGRSLVNVATNSPLEVEFLVRTREQSRLALAFTDDLKRIGIAATIRQMETAQYWERLGTFEFDIIQWTYSASLSPGNEQINRWGSKAADIKRSLNFAGVKSAAADAMISAMLKANDRVAFEDAVRAFDRVLLSGDYVIPLFHDPKQWIAASAQLRHPAQIPLFGAQLNAWWYAP